MRRFVTYCAAFAALVVATLALAECALRRVPNTYAYKHQWMQRHHSRVQTLILGNSLVLEGINPALVPGCTFNLCNVAQTMEQDRQLLMAYAPYDSLHTVVVGLSENILYAPLEQVPTLAVRATYYQLYMHCGNYPWWSSHRYELSRLDAARAKWQAYRQLRQQGRTVACDSLGFAPELLSRRPADWRKRGTGVSWQQISTPLVHYARNVTHLAAIARFCRQSGIRLVLVSTPLWQPTDAKTRRCYQSLGRWMQQQQLATYLDYSDDRRFDDNDFYDAHHLNDRGADKFTRLLVTDLPTSPYSLPPTPK